jgi:hypothetical protein
MGHARADVFRRHYLHQVVKVDTQSAYLGTVNRCDLVATVGLMSANEILVHQSNSVLGISNNIKAIKN